MRTVVISRSPKEATECNITVWQMLRVIQMLVILSKTGRLDTTCKVLFTFKKDKDAKYFRGSAMFCEKEGGKPIRTQPDIRPSFVFMVPDGESVDDSFGWLCSEVVKLAYAMTNGEVGQDLWRLAPLDKSVDDFAMSTSIKMEFAQLGPDVSLTTAALSPGEIDVRYLASWVHGK